jgi:hypothetical protein
VIYLAVLYLAVLHRQPSLNNEGSFFLFGLGHNPLLDQAHGYARVSWGVCMRLVWHIGVT